MSEERKITGYGEAINTIEENGDFYIMKTFGEGSVRGARRTYTYVKVDKEEYLARLRGLAEKMAKCPGVKQD